MMQEQPALRDWLNTVIANKAPGIELTRLLWDAEGHGTAEFRVTKKFWIIKVPISGSASFTLTVEDGDPSIILTGLKVDGYLGLAQFAADLKRAGIVDDLNRELTAAGIEVADGV